MVGKFTNAQQRALRKILSENAKASLFAHLGLDNLTRFKDFDLLYQSFIRATPVQDYAGWLKQLRSMTREARATAAELMSRPGLSSTESLTGLVWEEGDVYPTGPQLLADYATLCTQLQSQHDIKAGRAFYLFDYAATKGAQALPLPVLAANNKSWLGNLLNRGASAQNMSYIIDNGRSRYQLLHAFYTELQRLGPQIEMLIAPARLLTHFGLYVARQQGRFVSLKELCPNLRVFVQTGMGSEVHQTELSYLFSGLRGLRWQQMAYSATGLMAYQPDLNIHRRLAVLENSSVFYEFVPVDDMDASGRLFRNFRRLYAGQLTLGKEYVLLLTNPYGLMAYNTGWVVKIASTEPCQFVYQRQLNVLNSFGEMVPLETIHKILHEINEVLGGQGLFVRDFTVGVQPQENCHHWVLELSRPLGSVQMKLLESIGKRLHAELELQVGGYRQAIKQAVVKSPNLTFVGMGTFAALPDGEAFHYIDTSAEQQLIRTLLNLAGQQQVQVNLNKVL